MNKPIIFLAAASICLGCHAASPAPAVTPAPGRPGPVATNVVGAPDARAAVAAFMAASETQDIQALGAVFGTPSGPARNSIPRDELEKRELTMLCYLRHDKYTILSDAPGTNATRVFAVQLQRGDVVRSANFSVVQGPGSRWYVEQFDMQALTDLCRKTS